MRCNKIKYAQCFPVYCNVVFLLNCFLVFTVEKNLSCLFFFQYTHPLFRSNLNQGYHGHSPSPPSDISSSPDNIRGGYSSRPWTTGYSSYPPHQDTRLNSAPENTRPEHYNNGIPRIQAHSNPPRSFHIPETVTSGMGGGMISGLSGGGGGGMGDGSGMGVGWHQQQISNMQVKLST